MIKNIFVLAVVIILAIGVWFYGFNKVAEPQTPIDPTQTSFAGEYLCLPHKNTDGPQTMECAFGLKTGNGDYFALDFGTSTEMMNRPMNTAVTIDGEFVPIELISSNLGQIYPVRGIIRVSSIR